MTNIQKEKIKEMRSAGCGYSVIAAETGLSKDSVKAYCRSHNLGGVKSYVESHNVSHGTCLVCGRKFIQNPTRKEKKFCSDSCQMKWWNSHPELVNRRNMYSLVCGYCGQTFFSKNPNQKFCTRLCYANAKKEMQNG